MDSWRAARVNLFLSFFFFFLSGTKMSTHIEKMIRLNGYFGIRGDAPEWRSKSSARLFSCWDWLLPLRFTCHFGHFPATTHYKIIDSEKKKKKKLRVDTFSFSIRHLSRAVLNRSQVLNSRLILYYIGRGLHYNTQLSVLDAYRKAQRYALDILMWLL